MVHGVEPSLVTGRLSDAGHDLVLDAVRHDGGGVDVGSALAKLPSLEISDGGSVGAGNKRLAMPSETSLDDGDELVPGAVHVLVSLGHIDLTCTHKLFVEEAGAFRDEVLHVVNDGIDFVANLRVCMIVTVSDSEHTEDSAALGHGETILFPQGQTT